ncbi:hypothetical protein GCM10007390_09640 [Persicitalea jodogahamensis]|uniref:Uncharacterized protein n=1 Tax=Persicitalea jodogahamensis TaxID=402147 RepID=A0A8J3G7P1_9BACT|nr:hypothetical protein GCM10007390_09640 [Persicitalea jodogahamensis]
MWVTIFHRKGGDLVRLYFFNQTPHFMKLLLLSLSAFISVIGLFNSNQFDHLDITGDRFDISWDDITDDLWR